MAIRTAYTLPEAREMLETWKACEKALAGGQAKAYKIGTREFTSIDLPDIAARINYFANVIEALSGSKRKGRAMRIVPRDL